MNARLSRWAAGALVAGSLGLGVTGTAGAQSSETTFCADMTHVAKADAAAIQHPTEQDVHLLASDLDSASKALPTKAIVANRSQLASLIATNFLGHNTPAIAATESEYEQMWAQDVAAMFGSAGSLTSSSVDARVAPLARYVEHACPASVESLQRLDASEHLHLEDGPRTWP